MTTLSTELLESASRSVQTHGITGTIGVLTIGQSPRPDRLSQDIQVVLGPGLQVVDRGALDGMSLGEIQALAPQAGEYHLITLLRDGTPVHVSKRLILQRLQSQIDELEEREGVEATLLMCTGDFPAFSHRKPLLLPQAALYGVVTGIAAGGRIGALIPLESQREQARRKWRDLGVTDVEVVEASPYGEDPVATVAAASVAVRQAGARVLFMDCFGYDLAMKAAARKAFGGPVVLARSLAARLLMELVG